MNSAKRGAGRGRPQEQPVQGQIRAAARRVVATSVRAGTRSYERSRDLPGLIKSDPFTGLSETAEGIEAIVAQLERALRAERNRARAGHWTYDLNRHIALRQAYIAETERLAAMRDR